EPRRAAEDAARERRGDQSGEPDLGPALRRHADHRALHHRRDRRDRRGAECAAAREERQGGMMGLGMQIEYDDDDEDEDDDKKKVDDGDEDDEEDDDDDDDEDTLQVRPSAVILSAAKDLL